MHFLTTLLPDATLSICGTSDRILGTLTIPAEIDGIPVTEIADGAFEKADRIIRLILPEGLRRIGKDAFTFCDALTSVSLPQGLRIIDERAFACCAFLRSIRLPEGLQSLGCYAFGECVRLRSANIPTGLRKIGDYAFGTCESLTDLTVPDTFNKPFSLLSVFPFEEHRLDGCTRLSVIVCDEDRTV